MIHCVRFLLSPAFLLALVPALSAQSATLVQTIKTWKFSPPSPDPAGIVYHAATDRLIVVDCEVDETVLFTGKNIFRVSRSGSLTGTATTTTFSIEPTGIAIDPASNYAYIADDDAKRIFRVKPGADGIHGTGDDQISSFKTSTFGSFDPEGIVFDTGIKCLHVADGLGNRIWTIAPGANNVFDGVPPDGDDTVSSFDTLSLGISDPEGVTYAGNGELYVVGQPADTLLHCTRTGGWLRTIDISVAGAKKPAGITLAPGSQNSSETTAYIVDRRVDNDYDQTENDGLIYELRLPPWNPGNAPPIVDAGPDTSAPLQGGAQLTGSASDDGKPNPPGWLTTTWSKLSGPGSVSFGNPNALVTTANFSVAGNYVLRLRADDGAITAHDDVLIAVYEPGGNGSLTVRVQGAADDAEEDASGVVSTSSSDLELVFDLSNQVVGMRFRDIDIPPGATIESATVQFTTDEATSGTASLVLRAHDVDDAPAFSSASGNLSARAVTSASVAWSPAPWTTVGQASSAQRTSDVRTLLQEVIDRPGWQYGNAFALLIRGSGARIAVAYDGDPNAAPLLAVVYSAANIPPVVSAGPDLTVQLPSSASLNATVTDDGMPNPPGAVTTQWTKKSGPGTVTFANASSIDTSASFSQAGTYVLRLAASDGALSTGDETQVTVLSSGGGTVLDVRVASGADDAEERSSGTVALASSDLELVVDVLDTQTTGLRFASLAIPRNATITSAWIQFQADESGSAATNLILEGHDTDNALAFTGSNGNLSARPRTSAALGWNPPAWTAGQAGTAQRTGNLAPIVQEIVNRAGWNAGNALVILVRGSGVRTAESYEGLASGAALLHVEFH